MDVLAHIEKWQQLFTAIFPESGALASLLLLLLTIVLAAGIARGPQRLFSAHTLSPPISKTEPWAKLFNYIVVAFSQGILHPKLYA